jgi:hypothetical protein
VDLRAGLDVVLKSIISPLAGNLKPVIKPSALHFTELRNSKRTLISSLLSSLLVYGGEPIIFHGMEI